MCLPRPVLWGIHVLMIISIEYWEAESQGCYEGDTCYILQEGEKAIGDCDPIVHRVGSPLQLSCNSSSTNITADDITNFEWFKDGYSLGTRGVVFWNGNLSITDSGNYTCQLSGQIVSSYQVLVGGKPHTIPQPECISRILGQYNCSWDVGGDFNLATRYQLRFCYPHGTESVTCRDTSGTSSCVVNAHTSKAGYHVSLCAENCLGHAESSILNVDPMGSPGVKPYPPDNISLIPISSTSMNVTFDLPKGGWIGHPLGFYMYYTQSCTGYDTHPKEIRMDKMHYWNSRVSKIIHVTDQPYSEVCVTLGSFFAANDKPADYSDSVCAHTLMAKPSGTPHHFKHEYIEDDTDGMSLNFSWKELDPCESNGIIRWYILNVTSKTYDESFEIPGNLTSQVVQGLLWEEDYKAELYAVNDVGMSNKTVTMIKAVPGKIGLPGLLMIVFFSSLFLCFFLGGSRLYFKVKKRVLPKVPEPTYYNKPFMTQIQYSNLIEPEVFDELRTCEMVERTPISDSGETPLIGATTTSHESDVNYNYSRFGNSFDSSPHTGSRDFSGLHAARPGNVQHNTYTSYPGSTSTPPNLEDGASNMQDRKNQGVMGNEEDLDAGLDPYARFALCSEDDVFIDERETTSNQGECENDDEFRRDSEEPWHTDTRGLLYSSVTEVSADDAEQSPSINETISTPRFYPSETVKEAKTEENLQSETPLFPPNIPHDGKASLNESSYQQRDDIIIPNHTSPGGMLLTPGNEQLSSMVQGNESETPYTAIVNPQKSIVRSEGKPSGEHYHSHDKVADNRSLKTEEKVDTSYIPMSTASKLNYDQEQISSYSVSKSESNVRDTEGTDPYVRHQTSVNGSKSNDQSENMKAMPSPSSTGLPQRTDPYLPHPSTVSETSQVEPHASYDSGDNTYNKSSSRAVQLDPYVLQESAVTKSVQPNALAPSWDPLKPDTYVPHESGAATLPQHIASTCDPIQTDPYVSHDSAVARSGKVNPSAQDPYVSQDSVTNGPNILQGRQPDPYVSQESASVSLAQSSASSCDPLQPDPYVSHDSAAATSAQLNSSSCDPVQPDPYISHDSAAATSAQHNSSSCDPVQPDPYISHDSAAVTSAKHNSSSCDPVQPDPYISHDSPAAASAQYNSSSCDMLKPDPYVSHEFAAVASAKASVSSCEPFKPDPYVSHDSATTASVQLSESLCESLKPDPYVSHEPAATGSQQFNPSSQDPYVSQDSISSGSNSYQTMQPDPPYVPHESIAPGLGQNSSTLRDVSQDSLASETKTKSCKPPPPDPYVSHEAATAGLTNQTLTATDDPYICQKVGTNESHVDICHALQPDPYISHESAAAMSSQHKPSSSDQGISLELGVSRSDTKPCQDVQPDPYISNDSANVGQMSQNPTLKDDPYLPH